MKKTILGIIAIGSLMGIIFVPQKDSEAVTYYGHDGSIEKHLTKTKVEPYKGKPGLWAYIVKACATDRNLGVAAVILKSDLEQQVLGVNKNISNGQCSFYGAVIKAKDGKTLGAELIEKHEALQKYNQLLDNYPKMTKSQKTLASKELSFYRSILGGLV